MLEMSFDTPIFVLDLEQSLSSIYKKEIAFFGRACTQTRITGFTVKHSTSELSDRLMKIVVFNESLYLDSTQIEVFEFKFLKKIILLS